MKTILTLICLFICLNIQAQNCSYQIKDQFLNTQFEDGISMMGIGTTFIIVNNTKIENRPLTATICIATNIGINLGIKAIRKIINKHKR